MDYDDLRALVRGLVDDGLDRFKADQDERHGTLRDELAKAALTGIVANPEFFGPAMQGSPVAAAEFAVKCADALLAERARTPEETKTP